MGFTAGMEEVENERYGGRSLSLRPPARLMRQSAPSPAGEPVDAAQDRREEILLGSTGRPQTLRVRALGSGERVRVQDEMQLLAALEIAGLGAAPSVLEIEDDGYVRETAPPMRSRDGRGGGHRADPRVEPPTGERQALGRAREALDDLIEELHTRGWVLGAPEGGGLGVRSDGSVVVLDLHGLRREEGLTARRTDRHWVDSVLQDQDRTLRRRVHLAGGGIAEGGLVLGVDDPRRTEGATSAQEAAEPPQESPESQHMPDGVAEALPSPRGSRRTRRSSPARNANSAVDDGARADSRLRVLLPVRVRAPESLRAVLREPRLRRIALLSGTLVLVCGTVAGLWIAVSREGSVPSPAPVVASDPAEMPEAPVPRIEDAEALVAELAGARHSYLIGLSRIPASAPGSASFEEDERLRAAYAGLTVSGGGPVIHSAEVLEQTDGEDEAELLAVTSMEQVDLESADGGTSTAPATDPVSVRITVRWDGDEWLILRVAPEPAEEGRV